MSLEAVLIGTENYLKRLSGSVWKDIEVGIQPNGQPPHTAGQHYFAIYPTSWSNLITGVGDSVEGIEEVFGIGVCVTFRFGYAPGDRVGRELVIAQFGLLRTARLVALAIHGNYDLVNLINAEIPATENNVGEPLTFRSGSFQAKGPDWFDSKDTKGAAGYVMDLKFEGAKRLQPLA